MKHRILIGLICWLSLTLPPLSQANADTPDIFHTKAFPKMEPLSWLSENFMMKQRKAIDALTRTHFGKPLLGSASDSDLLQRLINEDIIRTSDKEKLQAMGVILGDIFVEKNRNLTWQIYEDALGKSHAVCIKKTSHCLFPITMLSRRMEAGAKPNVTKVYEKGIYFLSEHLPKRPFAQN